MHSTRGSRLRRLAIRLRFEIAVTVSWIWLLPVIVTIIVCFFIQRTPFLLPASRTYGEIIMPLGVIVLVSRSVSNDWTLGVMPLIVYRLRFWGSLLIRFTLILGWMLLVTIGMYIFVMNKQPIGDIAHQRLWIVHSMGIVLPPILIEMALVSVTTVLFVNSVAGNMMGMGIWFMNLTLSPLLSGSLNPPWFWHAVQSFLLFSWTYRPPMQQHPDWVFGKIILEVLGCGLLLLIPLFFSYEGRYCRYVAE